MVEVSIVMPCLNEAETIERVIKKAQLFFKKNNINGEVVIGDNGSTDGSQTIAQSLGAKVIHAKQKGYGSASRVAIDAAEGKYIITADTDDSHDLENLMPFIEQLRQGYDLVMGNRFKGTKEKNAMSFLHRYIGNPILTFIGNLFFKSNIGDFHCGLRGFTKEAYHLMDLKTSGMEFASEIVVKATLNHLKITEVPTTVFPAGRSRQPHLRSFPDGWRHLRFLLMYSPKWLFLYPGIFVMLFGFISTLFLFFDLYMVNQNWMIFTSSLFLIGFQFVMFFALVKIYGTIHKLLPRPKVYKKLFTFFTLEKGLLLGLFFVVAGILILLFKIDEQSLKYFTISGVSLAFGVQLILFSFFFSIMGINDNSVDE